MYIIEKIKDCVRKSGRWTNIIWKTRYWYRERLIKKDTEAFLLRKCKKKFGKNFSISNPVTFNEKLQWLKINWKSDLAEKCSDKYLVREYLISLGLGKLLNELYLVTDDFDKIDFSRLPKKFILKMTHGSHMNLICKDKDTLNKNKYKNKINLWKSLNYAYNGAEFNYLNLKPKIVIEKFLEDSKYNEIMDYRIFCFNGIPEFIHVDYDVENSYSRQVYDIDWNELDFDYARINVLGKNFEKPKLLNEMLEYSRTLSKPFPFVRVDFFIANDSLFFAELTFYPSSGFAEFYPSRYDKIYGDKIDLSVLKEYDNVK